MLAQLRFSDGRSHQAAGRGFALGRPSGRDAARPYGRHRNERGDQCGATFGSAFSKLYPGEDLGALREKFDIKAFRRRQEAVIKALIAMALVPAEVVAMPHGLLDATMSEDAESTRQKARYLALLDEKHLAPAPVIWRF